MSDENKNINEEELARQLDAKEQGINSNVYGNQTANAEADAIEEVINTKGLGRVDMSNFGPEIPEKSDNPAVS